RIVDHRAAQAGRARRAGVHPRADRRAAARPLPAAQAVRGRAGGGTAPRVAAGRPRCAHDAAAAPQRHRQRQRQRRQMKSPAPLTLRRATADDAYALAFNHYRSYPSMTGTMAERLERFAAQKLFPYDTITVAVRDGVVVGQARTIPFRGW